jgi:hypothetical protein
MFYNVYSLNDYKYNYENLNYFTVKTRVDVLHELTRANEHGSPKHAMSTVP